MSEEASASVPTEPPKPEPFKEIVQPFIDFVKAPRAIWGVNVAYTLEGLCYFGVLTYLTIYFSDFVFRGVPHADIWSHRMVMVLTGGIALTMSLLGWVPDRWGVRRSLLLSFVLLLFGRAVMSAAPTLFGLQPDGLGSPLHLLTMGGILFVTLGYGMYQPAAYAAVRQFASPRAAPMCYAMLYALMNAGGSLLMFAFVLRDERFIGLGIPGSFWVFTAITAVALLSTWLLLSKRTVERASAEARAENAALAPADPARAQSKGKRVVRRDAPARVPTTMWIVLGGTLLLLYFEVAQPWNWWALAAVLLVPAVILALPDRPQRRVLQTLADYPLADSKFFFFIFALIPVQTLFTYNWLVLPQYISRAYEGKTGQFFEFASNANAFLIFLAVPIVTLFTYRRAIYSTIILGSTVMACSAFVLAIGPYPWALALYIVLMTIGEAIWQPRFLQYATEIAPEGKAGLYQGVAQLPWFLTKVLVPLLYSGAMMERYCPAEGPKDTGTMWFIFGLIAIASPILLVAAKGWVGKGMKAKAA